MEGRAFPQLTGQPRKIRLSGAASEHSLNATAFASDDNIDITLVRCIKLLLNQKIEYQINIIYSKQEHSLPTISQTYNFIMNTQRKSISYSFRA